MGSFRGQFAHGRGRASGRIRRFGAGIATAVVAAALAAVALPAQAAGPFTGAIFTTNSTCQQVNQNIFAAKEDVYLDGGSNGGAAGLPDGSYFARVTDPSGADLLGQTPTAAITVTNSEFAPSCYRLWDILVQPDTTPGYADTTNPGGEYKVEISASSTFDRVKSDNFKVKAAAATPARLQVAKFYDTDTDGVQDAGEPSINGWQVHIQDNIDYLRFTPVDIIVDPDDYVVTELSPLETNWRPTTANPQSLTIPQSGTGVVTFGNVCLGAGGGLTLGFWSNKNGQANLTNGTGGMTGALAFLTALNLRTAAGANFDPTSYSALRSWLLNATATNMAYMLSAQLTAMELNVRQGVVNAGAIVYAPGAIGANAFGFMTVAALMNEANAELGLHGTATDGSPYRAYQEALKTALDRANNNLTFVQAQPCAFTFPAE